MGRCLKISETCIRNFRRGKVFQYTLRIRRWSERRRTQSYTKDDMNVLDAARLFSKD